MLKRLYESVIEQHLEEYQQMAFLAGPRQVGKTTISLSTKNLSDHFLYLNWDNKKHQQIILSGEDDILQQLKFHEMHSSSPILVFDELHKYRHWKQFLKGFYDVYHKQIKTIVTGSAKLNIYKAGSDSLMGRYLLYRIHPLSVAELLQHPISEQEISLPKKLSTTEFENLLNLGGFPEPYFKAQQRFATQWKRLRSQQLFREDIRDLHPIQDIVQLELFAELIRLHATQLFKQSNFSKIVQVSADTIKRWLEILKVSYYCFTVKPWSNNIPRSLIKEPKVFLWDWSTIDDPAARFENFIASHLLKAVHFWTDYGLGEYDLFFLRDKEKREVDFLVTKNKKPWFLVEAKLSSNHSISKSLYHFQKHTQAKHAFQVVLNKDYIDKDCFSFAEPIIVPAQTFLSQLV